MPQLRRVYEDPVDEAYESAIVSGALRQVDESGVHNHEDVYMAGCPCLCVPKTKWAIWFLSRVEQQ